MADTRDTEKDPDAFRTISEVADDLNLPQHVLRFWETRFSQIKPVKRAGGRRFYRPEDVDLLRGIRQLLYGEGYTIKGVQKILKEQGIRHVQDIGVERDVAAMHSVPTMRPPAAQEGVLLGGLLGLLPRRRARTHQEPMFAESLRNVEPSLPLPDFEAERDPSADHGEPLAPLPPRQAGRTRRIEERRFADGMFEERVYEEHAFPPEPRLDDRPHRQEPALGDDFDGALPPDEPPIYPPERRASVPVDVPEPDLRAAPSFAPIRPERSEPVVQRRPSRGPAARVSTAPVPDSDDPTLPFPDDETVPPREPDPLEARIRRLKAQEAGPPEEYLPPKLRRRPVASVAGTPLPADGSAETPSFAAWPELARASAAAERDVAAWHEHLRAPDDPSRPERDDIESRPSHHPFVRDSGESDVGPAWTDAWDDDPASGTDHSCEVPVDAPMAGASAAPAEETPADNIWNDEVWASEAGHDAVWSHEAGNSDLAGDVSAATEVMDGGDWTEDAEDPCDIPPVAPLHVSAPVSARLGMRPSGAAELAGSIRLSAPVAEVPVMASSFAVSAEALAAAPPRASAPVADPRREPAPRTGAPARQTPRPDPETAMPPTRRPPEPSQPWGRAHGSMPAPEPRAADTSPPPRHAAASEVPPVPPAFWQGREPFEAASSAPSPIDSYLPPHLRTDPRPAGQGGVQPVLSREDIQRLQVALYELGECRRLLSSATESKATPSSGT